MCCIFGLEAEVDFISINLFSIVACHEAFRIDLVHVFL